MSSRKDVGDLDLFQKIKIEKPVDLVIKQVRHLISSGQLKPGMRLPSERVLAERLNVGRSQIREALMRLEFYGILRTVPQHGTIVDSLGVKVIEGLISNLLGTETEDLESLMEIRALLEVHSARLAAQRATEQDLQEIAQACGEFNRQVHSGHSGLEEDHLFHLKIAEVSGNSVLRSLIGLITPDIIAMTREQSDWGQELIEASQKEHDQVVEGIQSRNPERAAQAMARHMEMAQVRRKHRRLRQA